MKLANHQSQPTFLGQLYIIPHHTTCCTTTTEVPVQVTMAKTDHQANLSQWVIVHWCLHRHPSATIFKALHEAMVHRLVKVPSEGAYGFTNSHSYIYHHSSLPDLDHTTTSVLSLYNSSQSEVICSSEESYRRKH